MLKKAYGRMFLRKSWVMLWLNHFRKNSVMNDVNVFHTAWRSPLAFSLINRITKRATWLSKSDSSFRYSMELFQMLPKRCQTPVLPFKIQVFVRISDVFAIIPTRSCKAWPKQFCKDDVVHSVLIICILHWIRAIRFFVANMLPRECGLYISDF